MSLKSFPIYSTVTKHQGKYLVSFFWRDKEFNLYTNQGNTFFFTCSATTADELNGEISRQFYAEYLRGTFDVCLKNLDYDDKSCILNLKNNNFVMAKAVDTIIKKQPTTIDITVDPLESIF